MRFEEAAPAAIVVGCATEKVPGSRLGPTDVGSSSHRGPSWSVVGIKRLESCGGSDACAITCGRERAALSYKPRFQVATGGMRRLALPQGAVGGRPSQGRVLHRGVARAARHRANRAVRARATYYCIVRRCDAPGRACRVPQARNAPAPASKRLEIVEQCRLACCRRWPTYRREGPAAQQHT